ncbi:MAG: hypothetical protein ACLPYM_11555 [Limisphaerales bacterium]
MFLIAIVPCVAKRKCLPPRAESKSQSITNSVVSCRTPVAKARLGFYWRGLDVVLNQTFLTPFDFLFASHKIVETQRAMLNALETTSMGLIFPCCWPCGIPRRSRLPAPEEVFDTLVCANRRYRTRTGKLSVSNLLTMTNQGFE